MIKPVVQNSVVVMLFPGYISHYIGRVLLQDAV